MNQERQSHFFQTPQHELLKSGSEVARKFSPRQNLADLGNIHPNEPMTIRLNRKEN
jgi:hypothetical protein